MYKSSFIRKRLFIGWCVNMFWMIVMIIHMHTSCVSFALSGTDLVFVDSYPLQPVVEEVSTFFYLSCCTGGEPGVVRSWDSVSRLGLI